MGERTTLSVKVDEDVANRFREFVQDKKGKLRGELGREVENAMREYMDNDRYERVEANQEETHEMLTSRGVMLLDTPPDELSVELVNRYIEIKRRGRL